MPADVDLGAVDALSRELGIRRLTARLLVGRGVGDAETARRFLRPALKDLRAPEGAQPMRGFARAVDRLVAALAGKETIAIFGDYDVDGVTSAALLAGYLGELGAAVRPRVARRQDGYGLRPAVVDAFAADGAQVQRRRGACRCACPRHRRHRRRSPSGPER